MTPQDFERIYEALAEGVDAASPEAPQAFLARACLLLAREIGDADRALALIAEAGRSG